MGGASTVTLPVHVRSGAYFERYEPDRTSATPETSGHRVSRTVAGPGPAPCGRWKQTDRQGLRRHLDAAGYPVQVITGDGEDGWPQNAPYDRVMFTAGVCDLPYALVEQCRPGALILAPWGPTFHPDEPLALLAVRDDGAAEGRFLRPGWCMPLRSQRVPQGDRHEMKERWERAGKPDANRYRITVTPDGQDIRLT